MLISLELEASAYYVIKLKLHLYPLFSFIQFSKFNCFKVDKNYK